MHYRSTYKTPVGFSNMIMESNGKVLTGLYFEGNMDEKRHEPCQTIHSKGNITAQLERSYGVQLEGDQDVLITALHENDKENPEIITTNARQEFEDTIKWLDIYFSGEKPNFTPAYIIERVTDFRNEVIEAMLEIPYGESTTYNTIAKSIAKKHGIERMAAQAVGGAVGWNPISIIIPCHRVLGAKGALTGYGGGIENKIALLKLEKNCVFRL